MMMPWAKKAIFIISALSVSGPVFAAAMPTCDVMEKTYALLTTQRFQLTEKEREEHVKKSDEEAISEKTHCGKTAGKLIELITGTEQNVWDFHMLHFASLMQNPNPKLSERELCDRFHSFDHQPKLKDFLLGKNEKTEHALFLFILSEPRIENGVHAFIIEKINDAFLILQSWNQLFTLAEWIGYHPWPNHKHFFSKGGKEMYTNITKQSPPHIYGNYFPLTIDQILDFIAKQLELMDMNPRDAYCYTKRWDNQEIHPPQVLEKKQ